MNQRHSLSRATSRKGYSLCALYWGIACSNGANSVVQEESFSSPGSTTGAVETTITTNGSGIGATLTSSAQATATHATGSSEAVPTGGVAPGTGSTSSPLTTSGTSITSSSESAATTGAISEGNSTTNVGSSGDTTPPTTDVVTRTASTFVFSHYPIETNSDGVWNGAEMPGTQPQTTTFDTVVLENGFLKVTLLPSYGGRILSLFHKPTNREFLYQNPVGTPYLMHQDIFYYDYLVILGGIFPSFPEPEHGKYWDQPYDFEVVSETEEAITVRMSRVDDRELAAGVPERYDVGRTDVRVALEVTLRAGTSRVELNTTLTNTRGEPVPAFEYWTITTLAPGSTPGDTAIPLNTRILAEMDQVHLYESSWAWFGSAEERIEGEVFKWQNLADFNNWVEQGTAFANPSYMANWSGLMNADNDMAIVCVTDPSKVLGLKLWTFGKDSLSVDITDSTQWLRPTIEMWHGVTPEFWMRGSLEANEVRSWTDHYFPTLGLEDITAANENGALHLTTSKDATETTLSVGASLTLPNQTVHATLTLDGAVVAEDDLTVSPTEPSTLMARVPNAMAVSGMVYEADFKLGDVSILSASIPVP